MGKSEIELEFKLTISQDLYNELAKDGFPPKSKAVDLGKIFKGRKAFVTHGVFKYDNGLTTGNVFLKVLEE
jgi:hypothetical protein